MNLNHLRERRDSLAKEVNNLLNNHPGKLWGAEQQTKYDEQVEEIGRVDAEIKRHQQVLDLTAEQRVLEAAADVSRERERSGAGAFSAASLAQAWNQADPAADSRVALRAAYTAWLRGAPNAEQAQAIRNTMSTTTGSEGGFTVPTSIANDLIDAMKDFSGVRNIADVIRTAEGNPLNYPGSDGTAEVGELIGENTTATAADPVFTSVAVNAFKYSSKIVAVPFELLQDSVIDVEAFVRKRLAERLGRIMNQHFTTGTGTGQPRGVVTGAATGKTGTTGQTVTVIFDDLVDLTTSVNIAYRQQGRARFMLRDASLAIVRKIKDSQGRPIFIPGWDGLGRAMPDTILGYPVQVNDDVAAMAANARSIAFGDFNYYKVRDVMSVTMFRFTDSNYARLGQVGFLAWMRSGGNLVDTTAVKVYINSAT